MRLMLSAFACDPVTGSEPYVGWEWVNRLAESYSVTLLTRTYSARLIEESTLNKKFDIVHFDLPGLATKDHYWKHIKFYYVIWQFCALFFILPIHLRRHFQVMHHLTYNVVDMPGWLAFVPGAHFIWGPVGGGQVPPPQLKRVFGALWSKQVLRRAAKTLVRFNPYVIFSARRASHVFFANRETAKLVARYTKDHSIMLETAIETSKLVKAAKNEVYTLLWLGNAIDRKALIIAIEAVGRIKASKPSFSFILTIAGDGPLLAAARARTTELGLDEHVLFLGRIPFECVLKVMDACDVFLFTSVQDTSGNVVLEAMSRGKPVICLDHQGAAEIVTSCSGIKIPVAAYDVVVQKFADAIVFLGEDTSLRERLGREAYDEVRLNHSWNARMERYDAVIRSLDMPA